MKNWRSQGLTCLVFVFCFALGGCATRPSAPDSPKGLQQVAIGLCEDYPEESRSIERAQQDLILLRTNDIRTLRVALGWDAIEPVQGQFDWAFWDEFFAAARQQGIRLIPYVCYTPRWAASDPGDNHWRSPPSNPEFFAEFMRQAARRYQGQVASWELWNEPDNTAYWTGSVEQFALLIKAGSRGVRQADKSAQVVLGGIAWDLDFLDKLMNQPGVAEALDVVNLHNYFETWSPDPAEDIDEYLLRADQIVRETGSPKPLWLAEVGYSNYRSNNFVSQIYEARFPYEHTAEFQAATVFRLLVPALATSRLSLLAWYRVNDLPPEQEVIGDVNNRFLGVLGPDGLPKPALWSVRFLNELFGDGFVPVNHQVRGETSLASDAEIYAFRLANGSLLVAAWLPVVSPGITRVDMAADPRQEEIGLRIPGGYREMVEYDPLGRVVRERRLSGNGPVGLRLRGGEVRLLVFE